MTTAATESTSTNADADEHDTRRRRLAEATLAEDWDNLHPAVLADLQVDLPR